MLKKCNYCEPAEEAIWQGTDKTARNTRHVKPTRYACDYCKRYLASPVRIEEPSKPVAQSTQVGLENF